MGLKILGPKRRGGSIPPEGTNDLDTWLDEKLKDPEFKRLYDKETAKLERYYEKEPWWKNVTIGVLASPHNIYKK